MKIVKQKIPLYEFNICLVQLEKGDKKEQIQKVCSPLKMRGDDIDTIFTQLCNGCKNGGDTYRNFDLHSIIVLFFPFSSDKIKRMVFSHEKRHVEDRVMEWASVDDVESAGLLAGYLVEPFYKLYTK